MIAQWCYLAAALLFVLGLHGMNSPRTAARGNRWAEMGMAVAVVGTLVQQEIVRFDWIAAGLILGSTIGILMAVYMPMTAMPQRIAISHAFGAIAATLVGVSEFLHGNLSHLRATALGWEVLLGSLTVTGSFVAFAKLQELLGQRPLTYPGQNYCNIALLGLGGCLLVGLIAQPHRTDLFFGMILVGLLFGVLLVLPIGGADMPVVISLLNSFGGLASAATGFVLSNQVLIIAGALDGASGFVLSILMCRAMNRSFTNVLFGAFGAHVSAGAGQGPVKPITVEDAAVQLAFARRVIVVPGYGMAVAQAQTAARELADQIQGRGGEVRFAIHPVAGRMPGHMNVLLAEANIPYDRLFDLEEINPHFPDTDVVLVVGANDVVNPAARDEPSSPIYGMPILDADKAHSIIVLKRSMSAGFAGIDNRLFYDPKSFMLFGDARSSLEHLAAAIKTV